MVSLLFKTQRGVLGQITEAWNVRSKDLCIVKSPYLLYNLTTKTHAVFNIHQVWPFYHDLAFPAVFSGIPSPPCPLLQVDSHSPLKMQLKYLHFCKVLSDLPNPSVSVPPASVCYRAALSDSICLYWSSSLDCGSPKQGPSLHTHMSLAPPTGPDSMHKSHVKS